MPFFHLLDFDVLERGSALYESSKMFVEQLLFVAGIQSDLNPNRCVSLVQGVSVYQ